MRQRLQSELNNTPVLQENDILPRHRWIYSSSGPAIHQDSNMCLPKVGLFPSYLARSFAREEPYENLARKADVICRSNNTSIRMEKISQNGIGCSMETLTWCHFFRRPRGLRGHCIPKCGMEIQEITPQEMLEPPLQLSAFLGRL